MHNMFLIVVGLALSMVAFATLDRDDIVSSLNDFEKKRLEKSLTCIVILDTREPTHFRSAADINQQLPHINESSYEAHCSTKKLLGKIISWKLSLEEEFYCVQQDIEKLFHDSYTRVNRNFPRSSFAQRIVAERQAYSELQTVVDISLSLVRETCDKLRKEISQKTNTKNSCFLC